MYENAFQKRIIYQILENQISVHKSPIIKVLYFTQNFSLSSKGAFHENSLSVACCTFGMVEIRTLTPNRFKNQSGDTMNILGQNCNHQQGFAKQRTVALHSGFKLKFPKHF